MGLEYNSEHPLAEALLQYAREQNQDAQLPTVEQFEAIAGSGVKGIVEQQQVLIGTQRWFDEMNINSSVFQTQKEGWEDAGKTVVFVAIDGYTKHGWELDFTQSGSNLCRVNLRALNKKFIL